jgi:transcription antitermination factor NusG
MCGIVDTKDSDRPCDQAWYALMVRTRYERSVAASLEPMGYDVFVPTYTARRLRGSRYRPSKTVLFPSYVFCRFSAQLRLPILMTPGVIKVVGTSNGLTRVREEDIDALKAIVDSNLDCHPWPSVKPGEWVEIIEGPLTGIKGTVVNVSNGYRFILNVAGLHRAVAVVVARDCVAPIPPPVYDLCG